MPWAFTAIRPTRMKPACAIEEYASSRLMSVWVRPSTAPTAIEVIATAHISGRQSHAVVLNPTYSTRSTAPNAATFVQAAISAVTGVGAPWYTSGVQVWNGATPALNSSPITSMASPRNSRVSLRSEPDAARSTSGRLTEPANPYSSATPYRKNADANAPSRKYLTAASWDSSRRRRASPASRYSGRLSTSSATNISSRLFDAGNTNLPPVGGAAGDHRGLGDQRAAGVHRALAEQQDGQQPEHPQQALQEQRHPVDGDRAGCGDLVPPRQQPDRDHRRRAGPDREDHLRQVPLRARHQRLDQHPDARRAQHDEHRCQPGVRD